MTSRYTKTKRLYLTDEIYIYRPAGNDLRNSKDHEYEVVYSMYQGKDPSSSLHPAHVYPRSQSKEYERDCGKGDSSMGAGYEESSPVSIHNTYPPCEPCGEHKQCHGADGYMPSPAKRHVRLKMKGKRALKSQI